MPWYTVCNAGRTGPTGERGAVRNEPVPTAAGGNTGSFELLPLNALPALPGAPPAQWVASVLHSAELNLLNRDLDACAAKLGWLTQLGEWWRSTMSSGENNAIEFARDKIHSIAANALAGLDAFGRDGSYVPLLSFGFLSKELERQRENALQMEAALKELSQQAGEQANTRQQIQLALDTFGDQELLSRNWITETFDIIKTLQSEIVSLRETLDRQFDNLLSASDTFQGAVRRRAGGGCGFKEILTVATMVTTVVATGGAAVSAVGATAAALKGLANRPPLPESADDWYVNIGKHIKQIATIIEPAGKSIEELTKAYGKAKTAIDSYEQLDAGAEAPQTPSSDYAKLLANKADFDKQMQEFRDLPEAQAYQREMDLFVATCETRNNKILEHDALVRRIHDRWATIRLLRSEAAVLVAARDYDYSIEDARDALGRMVEQVKWDLMRGATTLSRALEYLSGAAGRVIYDDRSVGSVAATLSQAMANYRTALETFGSGLESSEGLTVKWDDVLTADAKAALLSGHTAYFTIPISHPSFALRSQATTRRVFLPDGTLRGVTVHLEHQGRSPMLFRNGTLRTFSHVRVSRLYAVNDQGAVTDSGRFLSTEDRDTFVGVSPFGPWRVRLYGSQEARRQVLEGSLGFDIYSRTVDVEG